VTGVLTVWPSGETREPVTSRSWAQLLHTADKYQSMSRGREPTHTLQVRLN
jgi:hypothetical protein